MKVIKFQWCKTCQSYHPFDYPDDLEHEGLSGEYVSLAEYQELRQLLERTASTIPYTYDYQQLESPELTQLLSDIKEVLK